DDLSHAGLDGALEHVQRADDVDLGVERRTRDRLADRRLSPQVEDRVRLAADDEVADIGPADVEAMEREAVDAVRTRVGQGRRGRPPNPRPPTGHPAWIR